VSSVFSVVKPPWSCAVTLSVPSVLSVVKIVVVVCRNPFRIFGAFRGKTTVVVCPNCIRHAASTRFVYEEVKRMFVRRTWGDGCVLVTVCLGNSLIYNTLRPCDI